MTATTTKAMIAGAVMVLLGGGVARAATLRTSPIQPGVGQKLVCTVVNVEAKSLQMRAEILDRFGDNATDFARTDWNATETTVVTLHVESTNPNARFCRITVTGGRKADVAGSLQACSYDETACGNAIVAK